jgi:hypothetical protein
VVRLDFAIPSWLGLSSLVLLDENGDTAVVAREECSSRGGADDSEAVGLENGIFSSDDV